MMKNIQKTRVPKLAWMVVAFATLWSPAVHLFKLSNTPDSHTYTFIQGRDPSGWVWTIESPKQNYLTSILLERDVNIFLRADALAHIFVPYGWIATLLGIPGPIMLMLIEMLWNGLCAWALYQFFHTFLKKEKIVCAALMLAYFASGVSGIWLALNWLWQGISTGSWQHAFFLPNWVGEHHVFSFEFYENNQLVMLTSLNRPYYMMARFFGLCALILLHRAYDTAEVKTDKKKIWLASGALFMATFIHPASALIYGVMVVIWTVVHAIAGEKTLPESHNTRQVLQAGGTTLLGLIVAAILWKLYQQIPEVKLSVAQYTAQLYNAEAVAVWMGIALLATASFAVLMQHKTHRAFYLLILLSGFAATIGLSEFIIRDYAAKSRAVWLMLSAVLLTVAFFWKRMDIVNWIQAGEKTRTAVLFGSWALAITAISVSPHHDALKVVEQGALNLGALTEPVKKILEIGTNVYAARFKLGIWIPLSGLCAFLLYEYGFKSLKPDVIIAAILVLSLPSQLAYVWRWTCDSGGYMGYIPKSHMRAYKFLKQKEGQNVMCATETGLYILNGAKKRPLLGYGEDRPKERWYDAIQFFQSRDEDLQRKILRKYKIDYIFLSEHERQLGGTTENLSGYTKIYDYDGVQIFEVASQSAHRP